MNDRVFDCEGVIGGVGSHVPEVLLLSADMIRPMKTLTLIDKAKKRPKRILSKCKKKIRSERVSNRSLLIRSPLPYPLCYRAKLRLPNIITKLKDL